MYFTKLNSGWLLFIFPRKDKDGRIWGDHYTFVRWNLNPNFIAFHRTDVIPNINNRQQGDHKRTFCYIRDNSIIHFDNSINNYNIKNILCDVNNNTLYDKFPDFIEQDIITDIITFPWNHFINPKWYITSQYKNITSVPNAPPSSPISPGGSSLYLYKGKKHKIYIGKLGGKYIIVNKNKIYIKKQVNKNRLNDKSVDVIAIKDPIKTKIWWYTISWISKDGIFHKINRSSEELNGSLENYVKTLI
jgi:hypothetical protein